MSNCTRPGCPCQLAAPTPPPQPPTDSHGCELVTRHPETLQANVYGREVTLYCYQPWKTPKVWEGKLDPNVDVKPLPVEDRVRLLWEEAATMTATINGRLMTLRYDRIRCQWVY